MASFVEGINYGTRTDIQSRVGGQKQHGITHVKNPLDPDDKDILLFSNSHLFRKKVRKHFYLDRFFYESPTEMSSSGNPKDYPNIKTALYSGIGGSGDQNEASNRNRFLNEDVINHKVNNQKIHLFKSIKTKKRIEYVYVGEFELSRYFFEYQEDETGSERNVYIFELDRV